MSKISQYGFIGLAFGVGLLGISAGRAAPAQLPELATGQWQLREVDGSGVRSVCVADPGALFQIEQPGGSCSRLVLDSARNAMTVHYSCAGRGQGRSTLTVRSARSIRLETQGVATGTPFNADYDGRFVGPCSR